MRRLQTSIGAILSLRVRLTYGYISHCLYRGVSVSTTSGFCSGERATKAFRGSGPSLIRSITSAVRPSSYSEGRYSARSSGLLASRGHVKRRLCKDRTTTRGGRGSFATRSTGRDLVVFSSASAIRAGGSDAASSDRNCSICISSRYVARTGSANDDLSSSDVSLSFPKA